MCLFNYNAVVVIVIVVVMVVVIVDFLAKLSVKFEVDALRFLSPSHLSEKSIVLVFPYIF
jgi:hypothetical protein